jgi:gas vesicle protein
MNERTAVILGAALGAAAGAFAGYLFLTERGRRLRKDLEPRLEALLNDAGRVRDAFERARSAAGEGWRAVSEGESQGEPWPEADQRAPF